MTLSSSTSLPPLDLQVVEQQLLNKGAYSPLHWLLDCALLPYSAYEQWRYGEFESLEQALACDRQALLERLQDAERCAQALKLVNDPQPYFHWQPDQACRELTLSRNGELARLLAQRWVRPEDASQLDLFMDSGAAGAENELADCLTNRRWQAAETAYHQLCEIAPNNVHLGSYETLVIYGKHMDSQPPAAEELAEELAGLEADIAPLARDLLRAQAQDYLAPAWRRLAAVLPKETFDARNPSLHASYAWAQIPDWAQVIGSIEAVADYHQQASLLQRLAHALWHSRRREAALLLWGYLFELAPEQAEQAMDAHPIAALAPIWQDFTDVEPPQPLEYFPAWLLLREPGLAYHIDKSAYPVPSRKAATAIKDLLQIRAEGGDQVKARERLQAINPILLQQYLEKGVGDKK